VLPTACQNVGSVNTLTLEPRADELAEAAGHRAVEGADHRLNEGEKKTPPK